MPHDALIQAIQSAYPQLWFACHVEHRTRSRGLTDRDAGLLAHIGAHGTAGASATELALHLGIGKPALSQHLKRLHGEGLVEIRAVPADARRRCVRLSARGRAAVGDASPLNRERLARLLDLIPASKRRGAVRGLQCLAEAARLLRHGAHAENDK